MTLSARQPRVLVAFDGAAEAAFASIRETLPGSGWMQQIRADALARFLQSGLPHRRLEWWKYTDLAPRVTADLAPARPSPGTARPRTLLAGTRAIEIGIAEGQVVSLPRDNVPDGVEIMALRDALAVPSLWLRPWLQPSAQPLDNLNLAFVSDGALLRIGRGIQVAHPICMRTWLSTPGSMAHLRNVIVLEDGAEATLVDLEIASADRQVFATNRTSIQLGVGARLRHIRIIEGSTTAITTRSDAVELAANASYEALTLVSGPGLSRQDLSVSLDGEGARYDVACGYAAAAEQLADVSLEVLHSAPRTTSRILAKGIASGNGHGVVQGRVHVRKDAQQTDSHQLARGLMLTPGAAINHRPELEIYADDVKCGHGAAIGTLDENHLFYMQSRGIPAAEARQLLVSAYFADLTGRVPDAMREDVDAWVASHMTHAGGAA